MALRTELRMICRKLLEIRCGLLGEMAGHDWREVGKARKNEAESGKAWLVNQEQFRRGLTYRAEEPGE